MAKINPPKKKGNKPAPEKFEEASQNLDKTPKEEPVPLNFKVPAEFKHDFKLYALEQGISMVKLLERCFNHYKQSK